MHRSLASLSVVVFVGSVVSAAEWPQWRGPDRTNVSKEVGLAKEWPKDGPPLEWKATGLGDGVAPVSVSDGRVITTGNVGEDVVCTALAEKDGKPLWTAKLGPAAKEFGVMRWLAQAAPTVDGGRVYAVTANGDYVCLAADTGKVIWAKHFAKDFGGRKGGWGFCDYPLVDGDRLIVCPGGDKNTVAALDRKTGEVVWACPIKGESAAHSVLIAAELGGAKQYVVQLTKGMHGISADGKRLWSYAGLSNGTANTHAPIARDGQVFFANGYNTGHALLEVGRKDDTWTAKEVYKGKKLSYVAWLGSPTAVGEHILVNTSGGLTCLDWKTGEVAWEEKVGRCTYTVADGMVHIRTQSGKVILAAAGPKAYREGSRFAPPRPDKGAPGWTFPVVANGRLYVRDYDTLLCYDVRDPDRPAKKVPDAVFVPTPPDVVARMLELAAVTKADVVYDLGSGDGRIVVAAAKGYGCKAVGVEIDKELVAKSRERAKEAKVESLATFRRGDLFDADFADATVVALYILPKMSQQLIPKLNRLKVGSRVVSHAFAIPGVVPDRVVKVTSTDDDVERPVYLYTLPFTRRKGDDR